MANVYEVYGTFERGDGPEIFPIDIIEAADVEEALEKIERKSAFLRGWSHVLKLYRVPYYKTSSAPWRDDEIEFVCDI